MIINAIQYTDIFHTYYLKRRKEGLPYKKAVLATAHKLIRERDNVIRDNGTRWDNTGLGDCNKILIY
jgi:hypothetical protein